MKNVKLKMKSLKKRFKNTLPLMLLSLKPVVSLLKVFLLLLDNLLLFKREKSTQKPPSQLIAQFLFKSTSYNMLKNSPRLNTENPTERSLRFLQPSPLEFPKLLKKVPFKKSSLYSTTYLNKLKTLLIWKDLLKRNVLKPIRKTEISLLFQSE